jgi:hypothetical protein
MAEKLSKSILSNLKKMLHREPEKPKGSAPRKPSASKEAREGARKQRSSPPSVSPAPDQASNPEAQEAKPDKKKPKNQPWYRHRQRW